METASVDFLLDPARLEAARGGDAQVRREYITSLASVPLLREVFRDGMISGLCYDPAPGELTELLQKSMRNNKALDSIDKMAEDIEVIYRHSSSLAVTMPGPTFPGWSPQLIIVFPRFFAEPRSISLGEAAVENPDDAVCILFHEGVHIWDYKNATRLGGNKADIKKNIDNMPAGDWLLEFRACHSELKKVLDGTLQVSKKLLLFLMQKYMNYESGTAAEAARKENPKLVDAQLRVAKIKVRKEFEPASRTYIYDAFMQAPDGAVYSKTVVVDELRNTVT